MALTLVTAKSKPIGLVISKDLEIDKFYSAKYILQYIKSSTANQIINSYSNFVEVGHILHNGEMMTHTEAQRCRISKLKNLFEKLSDPPKVTRICDLSRS